MFEIERLLNIQTNVFKNKYLERITLVFETKSTKGKSFEKQVRFVMFRDE
jgi:hypothetical protein